MRPSLLLLATLAAAPAVAQDLSDDELLARFLAQRDAFRAVEDGDLGATRGLDLVTVTDLQTLPDIAPQAASAPPAGLDPVAAGDAAPATGSWDGPILATEAPVALEETGAEAPPVVATASAEPTGPGPEVEADAPSAPTLALAGDDPEVPVGEGAGDEPTGGTAVLASAPGADALDLGGAAETAVPTTVVYGVMPEDMGVNVRINFYYDSAVLGADQIPKLEQLCRVMSQSGIQVFRILGHTDAAGGDLYNERLSLLRAQEVRRWLITDCGLPESSLEAIGLGERFLRDPQDPRAADNRRVEFQALS